MWQPEGVRIAHDEKLANEAYSKFRRGQVCTREQLTSVFVLLNYYHKKHMLLAKLLMAEYKLSPEDIEQKVVNLINGGGNGQEKSDQEKTKKEEVMN